MTNQIINFVLQSMQDTLTTNQLYQLHNVLQRTLINYTIEQKQIPTTTNNTWELDLSEFLTTKTLEGKSPKTIKYYKYELKKLLSYINKPVKQITMQDVSCYMITYKCTRNISNCTLRNVRAIFNSFFGWLYLHNKVDRNIISLIDKIKIDSVIKTPFSDTERELLFRNCNSIRDKAMLEFLYSSAIRVSELVSIDISDIDFISKTLIVKGKGNKERLVYLNEKSALYLQEYLATRTDNNPPLFVTSNKPHNRLSKTGVEWIVRNIGKRAGVQAYPHRFRRTSATNALNRGMPVQEVSKMLGHTKIETTMIYCTVEQDSIKYHHKKYLNF